MDEEYFDLLENYTWDLVSLTKDINIIEAKWVFKLKKNLDGSINRHKSRLVE